MCFKSSIVIGADSWVGSTAFGIAQGLQKLGYEVVQVSQTTSLKLDISSNLSRIFNRLNRPINSALYNQKILKVVEDLDAKIFLTVKGNYIKPQTLATLRSRGVKTINYYPDFRFSYDSIDQATFPLYSSFITTKSFQVESLKQLAGKDKVHFLHHGYCSDIHYPPLVNPLIKDDAPDVLYIGTFTPYKEKLLTALVTFNPNINLKIYGYDWQNAVGNDLLKRCLVNRPVLGLNYAQLVNAAKINLAFHMGEADDTNWQDLVSTRSFELPACKGFMLHIDNPEIRQLYEVGHEIDVFSNAEDLSKKVEFYLANESIRQQMIEKAYRRCVPAYSYDQRAIDIATFIES